MDPRIGCWDTLVLNHFKKSFSRCLVWVCFLLMDGGRGVVLKGEGEGVGRRKGGLDGVGGGGSGGDFWEEDSWSWSSEYGELVGD